MLKVILWFPDSIGLGGNWVGIAYISQVILKLQNQGPDPGLHIENTKEGKVFKLDCFLDLEMFKEYGYIDHIQINSI